MMAKLNRKLHIGARAQLALAMLASIAYGGAAHAQGEDGTPAERNVLIISEMLSGRYDNANQAYFDRRLKKAEPSVHERMHLVVNPVDADISEHAFFAEFSRSAEDAAPAGMLFSLKADNDAQAVRMTVRSLDKSPKGKIRKRALRDSKSCDILWREEAGQFRGTTDPASPCSGDNGFQPREFLLSEDALWVDFAQNEKGHFVLERARDFSCYVDVPGVGGGRDIPYKRYQIEDTHDKGGRSWVTLDDGTELSITLQNIRWPMNNLENIFTRHSFVIYIGKKEGEENKEIGYAWTMPDAQRIGVNLKWMLVNCYMLSNEDVTPFFKTEPRL